jgi:hypothetical protein
MKKLADSAMTKRYLSLAMSAILFTSPLAAAKREVLKTDWTGFQEQVTARKLNGRSVRISIASGKEIKTELLGVSGDGLAVPSGRAVKRWSSGGKQVTVPKDQVISVRFEGRAGHGRAIGTAAGIGAGLGVSAAALLGHDISEGPAVILLPAGAVAIVGIGALVGYFAGRSRDRRITEFVLTH